MPLGAQTNTRIWFHDGTIDVPPGAAWLLLLLGDDEMSGPIPAGVVKDLVNTVVLAADGSPFVAAALAIVRLEQDGDVDDGKYWDTGGSWQASATPPASAHQEAGQHLYQLPAIATVGRNGARITVTFADSLTEASVTTLCGTKEYLIGDITAQPIVGAAINQIPNSASAIAVGTVAAGTFASAALLDGLYWQIQDDTGQLDMYFEFLIAADGVPTGLRHEGRVTGNGDDLDVFAWNWAGAVWEQIGTITGKNSPSDETNTFALFTQHVGAGADLGKVRVRFFAASGLTSADFYSDQVVLSYVVLNRSIGYADGAIWVDTINGSPGSNAFINGVADNPVKSWADALALSATLGIRRFRIAGGSAITLTANSNGYTLIGAHWGLALGGQSVADTTIEGANVSGVCTAATPTHFLHCHMEAVTIPVCHFHNCALAGPISLFAAGAYVWNQCYPGSGTPVIDFGSVGDTQLSLDHYSGIVEVANMGKAGTDTMSLEGDGEIVINTNCVGGLITVRGNFERTDNAGGAVTISDDAQFSKSDLASYLETDGPNPHGTGSWVDGAAPIVKQNFGYSRNTDKLRGNVWIEASNLISLSVTAVVAILFDKEGTPLFVFATSVGPDAQGVFRLEESAPGLTVGEVYYVVSVCTVTGIGSVVSGKGSFTV